MSQFTEMRVRKPAKTVTEAKLFGNEPGTVPLIHSPFSPRGIVAVERFGSEIA